MSTIPINSLEKINSGNNKMLLFDMSPNPLLHQNPTKAPSREISRMMKMKAQYKYGVCEVFCVWECLLTITFFKRALESQRLFCEGWHLLGGPHVAGHGKIRLLLPPVTASSTHSLVHSLEPNTEFVPSDQAQMAVGEGSLLPALITSICFITVIEMR